MNLLVKNNIYNDAPVSWQLSFQNPATPVMEGIINLHNYIFMYLIIVFVVVVWFLGRSLFLFHNSKNPEPKEFSHDPVIESVWTVAPAFILIAIAMPSFSLLYSMEEVTEPFLTVKVIGHQWYWSYELDAYRTDNLYDYFPYKQEAFKIKSAEQHKAYKLVSKRFGTKIKTEHQFSKTFKFFKETTKDVVHLRFNPKPKIFPIDLVAKYNKLFRLVNEHRVNSFIGDIDPNVLAILKPAFFKALTLRQNPVFYELLYPIVKEVKFKHSIKWISPPIRFDSFMVPTDELPIGYNRLLEVDRRLVLPINLPIRLLVTSTDVIHSWAVPSLGVKVDAIPGRLNQTFVTIKRPGVFYGQCSELCGVNHAFMPIAIQAVDFENFCNWVNGVSNTTDFKDFGTPTSEFEIRIDC